MDSEIVELRQAILRAKQAYYYGDCLIISDSAFDALENRLRSISPNDPVLKIVGAPVPPDNILTKAKHRMAMGSQGKVNSADECKEWIAENAPGEKIHVSWKGDGGSAAAYYEDGYLKQGISRGDGEEGQDITSNMMKFSGLPAYIETSHGPFNGSIRFEVILTKVNWKIVDPTLAKNPRNTGNGIMGRKDGTQNELLTVYAFDVVDEDYEFKTETEKSQAMENMGINVINWRVFDSPNDITLWYEDLMEKRGGINNTGTLPIWIDGIVLKVDDLSIQDKLGAGSDGKPKGQVAWKPENEGAITKLIGYEITASHTGALVPNARFTPIAIGGTTVSNALLNNWDEIARLDVAVGDMVMVIKANDIIPKVISVVNRPKNRKKIEEPTECPSCGGAVQRRINSDGDEGAITVCIDPDCPAKSGGKVKNWFKKLKILGVGDSVREALKNQLGIETPADIYKLGTEISIDEIANMSIGDGIRMGESRAETLVEEINKKREIPLNVFVGSLGIQYLQRRRAELIMEATNGEFDTLEDWQSGKLRKLADAAGVPGTADAIQDGIDGQEEIITQLLARGVRITTPQTEQSSEITVCITGTLPSGKKKVEYKDALAAKGIALVDDVSKELTYLVVADPTKSTSKTVKVQKYNSKGSSIKIISEDELINLTK